MEEPQTHGEPQPTDPSDPVDRTDRIDPVAPVDPEEPTDPAEPAECGALALREPAHQVSPRAVTYWRLTSAAGAVVLWLVVGGALLLWPDRPAWAVAVGVVLAAAALVRPVVMPPLRHRVTRWEVTPTAVHTRTGWLSRESRVAPLSRVQTVDAAQSGLMRLLGLRSITVTTASAAGPLVIECLDEPLADRVVAELTAITGRAAGDAT